jgi:hypothetical protein
VSATRACHDAIGPAQALDELKAAVGIRKVADGLYEGLGNLSAVFVMG